MTRMTDERLAEYGRYGFSADKTVLIQEAMILLEALIAERQRVRELEELNHDLRWKMNTKYWDEVRKDNVTLKQQLQAAEAKLADREGVVCDDCDGTGWLENRVDGRHPCTCITEAEPYQILEAKQARIGALVGKWRNLKFGSDWYTTAKFCANELQTELEK